YWRVWLPTTVQSYSIVPTGLRSSASATASRRSRAEQAVTRLWQRYHLGARLASLYSEQCKCAGRLLTPVGGAARIEQQETIAIVEVGNMAVAKNYDTGAAEFAAGSVGVGRVLTENMGETDGPGADHH